MTEELPLRPNPPIDLCEHGDDTCCEICDPMPIGYIDRLNAQIRKGERVRQGKVPLRRRRKRLHKKLAKRGFSASPTMVIWSSRGGYGTQGTGWDIFHEVWGEA